MDALRLYGHYVVASIRSQMQYPGSFALLTLAQFAGTVTELIGIWALFQRFRTVAGWSFGEVAVFYGVINIAFGLADALTRGFDVFGPEYVKTGSFDRLLLRPRTAALQVLGHELRLTRIGRLVQGVAVLAVGIQMAPMPISPASLGLIALALAGGMALFCGILILQATLSFWTVESLEVANVLTYGGVQAGQYPISIYASWFRDFITFIVPIACVAYLPVVGALERADPLGAPGWVMPLAPFAGFVFLAMSLWVWGFGVRRYRSTGS